jgi:penicillin amidase
MRKRLLIGLIGMIGVAALTVYSLHPFYVLFNPVGGIWTAVLNAEHPSKAEILLENLTDTVEVYRDTWGVPHIYARNEHDLFYVFGYVQAQDRLWQMDMQRRVAEGKLAEILGADLFDTDLFFRTIGLARAAEASLEQLDQTTKQMLSYFTMGINKAIENMKAEGGLPIEFKLLKYEPEPWTPLDSLAISKLIAWSLTGSFVDLEFKKLVDAFGLEIANELFPIERPYEVWIYPGNYTHACATLPTNIASDETKVFGMSSTAGSIDALLKWKYDAEKWVSPFRTAFASNNWVVHGNRTSTGKPILANDPHLELMAPPVWYEAHLVVTNSSGVAINVRGVTFPGLPLIIIGANQYLAWGFTNVGADVIDFYEYVWSDNDTRYWYVDHLENVQRIKETIRVKTSRGIEERVVYVNKTRHGPILERDGFKVAMQWVGRYPSFEARALYKYNIARNITEFLQGLADFYVPAQNTVYADVYGNIGWWANGRYVNRTNWASIDDLRLPFNGSAGEGEWSEDWIEPPDEVPHVINPEWGFVVTANNRPVGPTYPYWLGWTWAERYRAQRILKLINVTEKIGVDYMKATQTDVFHIPAREFVPFIIEAYQINPLTGQLAQQVISILQNWNYTMRKDLVAPTIFVTWLETFKNKTFGDDYKRAEFKGRYPFTEMLEYFVKNNASKWFDDTSTPNVIETRDDIIIESLNQTIQQLEEMLGEDVSTWKFELIHRLNIQHLLGRVLTWLNYPEFPIDGWENTVNPASGFKVSHGASWRQIIDLSNLNNSINVLPGGQRGNPFSKHYYDQLELWLNGGYKPMKFVVAPQKLEDVESRIIFRPK